jgi:histidyl-tRNA synthetase
MYQFQYLQNNKMKQETQTIRGIRDLVNHELAAHRKIVKIGEEIAILHNYSPIILPIFEYSSVFHRTLGETSDIVNKETYTFIDRDKRTITLRPEFTAAMVRSMISNGWTQNLPKRFFTYGPLFRHERPQKGRYRQFYQFNCELFGSASPYADVEIISMMLSILKALKVEESVELEINSLGDPESAEKYRDVLKKYFLSYESKLSELGRKRLATNPLRLLDTKDEEDMEIVQNAPIISDYLNQESLDYYSSVCEGLTLLNIKYKENPRLVRGLDYYTHIVFEVKSKIAGSQNAIGAGGRYNNLFEDMGGPSIPAVGFGLGVDRIYDLLTQDNVKTGSKVCYLIPIGNAAENHAISLANDLRSKGIKIALDYDLSAKKRLKIADREKACLCIIFGDDELESNEYIVRNMADSQEEKAHSEELDEVILKFLQQS